MRQRKDPTRKAAKNLGNVKIEATASDGAENASDHFVTSFLVFGAAKLSRHVRLGTEKPLVYASVRRFCVPAADSTADFILCREMLHGAHKQNHILRMKLKIAVQSVRRVRQF